MLYSMKMRASRTDKGQSMHISGAEKIIPDQELGENAVALINRALHHAKGRADFVNLKLETVPEDELTYIEALPVHTASAATPAEGQALLHNYLSRLGISNTTAIMAKFRDTYAMRGAMLLDVDTLERLEPDQERGIRATYMDAERQAGFQASSAKNHFQEAIVLASKVVSAPGIVAEICISDDPDYVTGYVAAPSIGYVRITCLKEMGCPDGGRIFLYRGKKADAAKTIYYLEKQKVLVRNAPLSPIPEAECAKDPWKVYREDINLRKKKELYRSLKVIDSAQTAHITSAGKELLLLASNGYLGLADEPRIKKAAQEAIDKFGTTSGGSRLTTGNMTLHMELEAALAKLKGTEAAIVFNAGYMANVGIISALGRKGATIFSDELNHASIIDGCRLSSARTIVYKHNDMEDLESKIKTSRPSFGLIVADAVFSMDGDIANLPQIIRLGKKYGLLSMVDEAHATGVIGKTGHGIVEHFGLKEKPDILMGTLSKALASEGGYACGSQLLIEYLRNCARSFIFATSLAPATLAAAKAAVEILDNEPEHAARLQENTDIFVAALQKNGIDATATSAIVPIIIGDEGRAMRIASRLYDEGIYLSAIRYPTVAKGTARLRAALMATHQPEELEDAAHKIAQIINETD